MVSFFMTKTKFTKQERLCSHTAIGELFSKGNSFFVYPLKVIYSFAGAPEFSYPGEKDSQAQADTPSEKEFCLTEVIACKVLFSVPKKHFRLAVDRNRIKRQLREAFRLEKQSFAEHLKANGHWGHLAIVYTSKSRMPYKALSEAIKMALKKIETLSDKASKATDSSEESAINDF